MYLWRAVDEDGDELDILVQSRRNRRAATRFLRKVLKGQGREPRRMVTDKQRSCPAACRTSAAFFRPWARSVMPSVVVTDQNNRAEVSHQPTRQRECQMRHFKSAALPVSGTVIGRPWARSRVLPGGRCLREPGNHDGSCAQERSGKNRALVEGLGAEHVLDYTEASFGSQLASEGRCVDSTVDLLGGRDTHRQGLAVTRKQGSFVTVVGPEQHVGQRRLSAFQLLGMLGRISWSMLGSRFSGPRYVFAAPLLSLHTEC